MFFGFIMQLKLYTKDVINVGSFINSIHLMASRLEVVRLKRFDAE